MFYVNKKLTVTFLFNFKGNFCDFERRKFDVIFINSESEKGYRKALSILSPSPYFAKLKFK